MVYFSFWIVLRKKKLLFERLKHVLSIYTEILHKKTAIRILFIKYKIRIWHDRLKFTLLCALSKIPHFIYIIKYGVFLAPYCNMGSKSIIMLCSRYFVFLNIYCILYVISTEANVFSIYVVKWWFRRTVVRVWEEQYYTENPSTGIHDTLQQVFCLISVFRQRWYMLRKIFNSVPY